VGEAPRCEECGLPMVECSATANARHEVEQYLREHGYGGQEARSAAARLVPDTKRKE